MAVTYTPLKLTGSTDGEGIPITAITSGTAITIHTAVTNPDFHEIFLWASNIHTGPVTLTIEFGAAAFGKTVVIDIPAKAGLFYVIPGLRLQGSKIVKAFASVASKIGIFGHANLHDIS